MSDKAELERLARKLDASDDFRVLRRLSVPSAGEGVSVTSATRIAVAVDTETTGLDPLLDEVIEVGAVAFTYTDDEGVGEVVGTFQGLREPAVPITPEVTAITGIDPDMVRGKSLDLDALESLIQSAALIIAHNAAFDRPFCERISPVFASKHWACSATDVPWRDLGFEGVKLAYLLNQSGFFHDGHRALDDAVALMQILTGNRERQEKTPLHYLLESARKPRLRVEFEAPYELRLELRKRGYQWKARQAQRGGVWRIEVDDDRAEEELAFARSQQSIPHSSVVVTKITALNRYKD